MLPLKYAQPPTSQPREGDTPAEQVKLVPREGVDFPSLAIWVPQMELFAIANCKAPSTFPF